MSGSTIIHCGPSGWTEKRNSGRKAGPHPLEAIAEAFNGVEIADTSVRMPRPERCRVWLRRVDGNRAFRFAAVLPSSFTQGRELDEPKVREFRTGLGPLLENGRLGAVLMQFPWSFRYTAENREYLIRLRRTLTPLPLSAEFLHASWSAAEAIGTLIDYRIGFCNVDQLQQTKTMTPSSFLTTGLGYVRLRGRAADGASYRYDDEILQEWCGRVQHIAGFAERVFLIAAGSRSSEAAEAAERVSAMLRNRSGAKAPAPVLEFRQPLLPQRLDSIAVA